MSFVIVVAGLDPISVYGLEAILASDPFLDVIRRGPNERALLRTLRKKRPDTVIFQPPADWNAFVRLAWASPTTGLVLLGDGISRAYMELVKPFGVQHLSYRSSAAEVHAIVKAAAATRHVGGESTALPWRDGAAVGSLTSRERDVFRRILHGDSHAEIAADLGIGVRTVKSYTLSLRRKLGLSSGTRLRSVTSDPRCGN